MSSRHIKRQRKHRLAFRIHKEPINFLAQCFVQSKCMVVIVSSASNTWHQIWVLQQYEMNTKPHKDLFIKPNTNNIILRFSHILRHKIIIEKKNEKETRKSEMYVPRTQPSWLVRIVFLCNWIFVKLNLFRMSRWQLLRSIFASN